MKTNRFILIELRFKNCVPWVLFISLISYACCSLLLQRYQMSQMDGKFWLVRVLFVRCLALMYAVAFLVALNQNESLIGEHGLTPAVKYLANRPSENSVYQLILAHPSIFWLVEPTAANINQCAGTGLVVSLLVAVLGCANMPIMFTLWALYFSIVTIGQRWYSFGWESQLLETGFLAMFMVPLSSLSSFPALTPTPWVAVWGYRWLLFRIMIGAGMIKIRGDQCWRDLTCMNYHYQTQPVPNPLSIYFHNNPEWVHRIETMGNHVIELVLPALLLIPHRMCNILGGAAQILFQVVLILSGNLAFLNWLTALPAVMCFDDASVAWLFSREEGQRALQAEEAYQRAVERLGTARRSSGDDGSSRSDSTNTRNCISNVSEATDGIWTAVSVYARWATTLAVALLIAYRSYPVVNNILSPNQAMNVSFDAFRIVNSYGAFGSITKVRHEVILQGTRESTLHADTVWKDFEFTCKPGDINRRPCWISPYHLRIDWLMWFAAFQNYQQCPWLVHLVDKLLSGDPVTAQLLAPQGNPFDATADGAGEKGKGVISTTHNPPAFVRAELYEYQYSSLDAAQGQRDTAAGWEVGRWWKRRWVQSFLPAVDRDNESVRRFLQGHRMID